MMADERDRLRARLGLAPLPTTSTAAPVVDERTQRQAMTLTPAQLAARQSQAEAAQAQAEAATALTEAKANAEKVARQLGAKIDPATGKIDVTTIPKTPVVQNAPTGPVANAGKILTSTYTDSTTGDVIAVYSDGSTAVLSKGTKVADAARAKAEADAAKKARGESAFAVFRSFLDQFGIGALAADVEKYKLEGLSDQELLMRLRTESTAYKQRFAANEQRIKKGLRSLSEAEYIGLEDQYQDVMRRYGLPNTYYARGEMGRQEGFEKFIANDISAVELEDRIATAQNRVINANPEVSRALKEFYPDITNGDILAYTLDPKNAIKNIQRKVTAAEIGGAAMAQGLQTGLSRAEELAGYGVTKDQAQQGYQTVAEVAPRGSMLSDIYRQGPYGQVQAEQEVFNLAGSAEAARQRKKLTSLETAAFSGQAGVGALARERAGNL